MAAAALYSGAPRGWFRSILIVAAAGCALITYPSGVLAKQFSLNCKSYSPYFMTFDTEAGRVIYESISGTALKGIITERRDDEISFELIRVASPRVSGIWSGREGQMTWPSQTQPNSPPWDVHKCTEITLRPVMAKYNEISPFNE